MGPEAQRPRHLARNEALFRDVNEAIERGLWPEQEHHVVRFRCECAADCGEAVELSPVEYERVRTNPRRFILLDGHQISDVEDVVERHPDYLVVEKRGETGEAAEELDPRS